MIPFRRLSNCYAEISCWLLILCCVFEHLCVWHVTEHRLLGTLRRGCTLYTYVHIICSHNIVHVCSEYSTHLLNFGLTPCEAILKSITSKQSLISTFTKRMFHKDNSPGFRSLLGQSQGRYRDQDNFDSTKSKYTAPRFHKLLQCPIKIVLKTHHSANKLPGYINQSLSLYNSAWGSESQSQAQ